MLEDIGSTITTIDPKKVLIAICDIDSHAGYYEPNIEVHVTTRSENSEYSDTLKTVSYSSLYNTRYNDVSKKRMESILQLFSNLKENKLPSMSYRMYFGSKGAFEEYEYHDRIAIIGKDYVNSLVVVKSRSYDQKYILFLKLNKNGDDGKLDTKIIDFGVNSNLNKYELYNMYDRVNFESTRVSNFAYPVSETIHIFSGGTEKCLMQLFSADLSGTEISSMLLDLSGYIDQDKLATLLLKLK